MNKMKATVFDLGTGIGVCLLKDAGMAYVGEVRFDPLRVLPQSLHEVAEITTATLEVVDEATAQDHVDRAALGLKRFRVRLNEFADAWPYHADIEEWQREATAAADELGALIARVTE